MPRLADIRSINCLNPSHPLNVGKVAQWLVLPNNNQGSRWQDLTGRFPGTLTNMAPQASGFRSTARPGGYRHVVFDGVNDYIALSTALATAAAGTATAWVCPTSSAAGDKIVMGWGGSGSNAGLRFGLSTLVPYIRDRNVANQAQATASITVNTWTHIAFVGDQSIWTIYINGVAQSLTVTGSNTGKWFGSISSQPTGTLEFSMGTCQRFGTREGFFPGAMDAISLWSRALSAAEVAEDYALSQIGYPGVLNYPPTFLREYFKSASGLLLERRRRLLA